MRASSSFLLSVALNTFRSLCVCVRVFDGGYYRLTIFPLPRYYLLFLLLEDARALVLIEDRRIIIYPLSARRPA